MARSNVLLRLSRRKHEGPSSVSNDDRVKQAPSENSSWRRKSLASLSRRLSPGLRHAPLPPPATDSQPSSSHHDNVTVLDNAHVDDEPQEFYPKPVKVIRQEEYPHMSQGTYLDHSGTTIYARSTITRTTTLLLTNLYGNPHSANQPANLSGEVVDAVRAQALRFLGADPRHYDLVFTANATAAIKLVADAFRDLGEQTRAGRFWYGYHADAHTSLVGVRELVGGDHVCFEGDGEVEAWLDSDSDLDDEHGGVGIGMGVGVERERVSSLGLFAYPGQSNLTGRRLPLEWAGKLRRRRRHHHRRLPPSPLRQRAAAAAGGKAARDTYTLLDAAALAMTYPMARVFADPEAAPDFTCVSFYKIFGFPDLGGLVVRKESGHILALRKYFGGGTVAMVSAIGGAWHLSKGLENSRAGRTTGDGEGEGDGALHEGLEDGTLPFHSILALGEAIDVHAELYGSMENVSAHTTALARRLYEGMRRLRYGNGQPLCMVYKAAEGERTGYGDAGRQGATVAFNVFRADGGYESYSTVERLANERGVYVRSGGICCPGGLYTALQYEPWHLNRAKSAGHHCGPYGLSLINELPTGVVRASLGAMSTRQDVDRFLAFLHETFVVAREDSGYANSNGNASVASARSEHLESIASGQQGCVPQAAACCSV